MAKPESRVTVHMAASLDGYIASRDGGVGWMETADHFEDGVAMDPQYIADFLTTIDCYVMGSRTYETALEFVNQGYGWAYGDKPAFVLTSRVLPQVRPTVQFLSGDLRDLVVRQLKPRFSSIWVVGGGAVCGECLRLELADEVRISLLPVVIGEGIPFLQGLDKVVALHLKEVKTYQSGIVALRHEVKRGQS